MSRFILNLRMLDRSPALATVSIGTQVEDSLHFDSGAFDNLGAPLDIDDDNHRE